MPGWGWHGSNSRITLFNSTAKTNRPCSCTGAVAKALSIPSQLASSLSTLTYAVGRLCQTARPSPPRSLFSILSSTFQSLLGGSSSGSGLGSPSGLLGSLLGLLWWDTKDMSVVRSQFVFDLRRTAAGELGENGPSIPYRRLWTASHRETSHLATRGADSLNAHACHPTRKFQGLPPASGSAHEPDLPSRPQP